MEFCVRRRVLKTCLSVSFLFTTLVTIHKLHVMEAGAKDLRSRLISDWIHRQNGSLKKGQDHMGPEERSTGSGSVGNASLPPPKWDIAENRCSDNVAAKNQPWLKHLDVRFQQFILQRHCRYYPLLLNHPEKCQGHIDLLIVVKSMIEQHDRREAVRRTWGQEKQIDGKNISTLFLLGTTAWGKDHRNLQRLIEQEDQIYGDILQWDFMDTFFNLTLKEVNFLKWFDIYCPKVQFVFKGDDDIFVHTRNVLDFLDFKKDDPSLPSLFVGDIITKATPIRNKLSKYFIPQELHNQPYPMYAGGGGFLMASTLARRLFVASQQIQLFPIDDVFLGMCLQRAGVVPKQHSGFRTFGISRRKSNAMNQDPCLFKSLLVVHRLSSADLLKMWKVVQDDNVRCARFVHI